MPKPALRTLSLSLATAALVIGSCAVSSAGRRPAAKHAALTGNWGGDHIGLTLSHRGGRVDYDCGAGSIDAPLVPDAAGRFAVSGTHRPGMGGPARMGVAPPSFPARYSGTVRGTSLQLRVEVPAQKITLGPFDLRKDAPAMLLRCL